MHQNVYQFPLSLVRNYHKCSQWLKIAEMYSFTGMEVGCSKSEWLDCPPSEGVGEIQFLAWLNFQ